MFRVSLVLWKLGEIVDSSRACLNRAQIPSSSDKIATLFIRDKVFYLFTWDVIFDAVILRSLIVLKWYLLNSYGRSSDSQRELILLAIQTCSDSTIFQPVR